MATARDLLSIAEAHAAQAMREGRTLEGTWGIALVRILRARVEQDTTDRVLMTLCPKCGAQGQ